MQISAADIQKASARVPDDDFVAARFDVPAPTPTTQALIIWSTPRSGSTFLCDLLRQAGLCMPHEYFQTEQYVPLLAERWHCLDSGRLNEDRYIEALKSHRTFPNGLLGINVHGEHLRFFSGFAAHFDAVDCRHIHLRRRDQMAQAVSYEIAMQTNRWSSAFPSEGEARYSYEAILRRLRSIEAQNAGIVDHLKRRRVDCAKVFYEDLVIDPVTALSEALPPPMASRLCASSALLRQADQRNEAWRERFTREYKSRDAPGPLRSLLDGLRALLRSVPR